MNVADVDWDNWEPEEVATLMFVHRKARVLLIRKKRGLGAGKINAPGGRLEPGETALECAVREVEEELCITPLELAHAGENRFQFVDGYSIHVQIFRASDYRGEPSETEEAVPLWTPLDAIPYEEMWEDDRVWLPLLIAGTPFAGRFIFDNDVMLDHALS